MEQKKKYLERPDKPPPPAAAAMAAAAPAAAAPAVTSLDCSASVPRALPPPLPPGNAEARMPAPLPGAVAAYPGFKAKSRRMSLESDMGSARQSSAIGPEDLPGSPARVAFAALAAKKMRRASLNAMPSSRRRFDTAPSLGTTRSDFGRHWTNNEPVVLVMTTPHCSPHCCRLPPARPTPPAL